MEDLYMDKESELISPVLVCLAVVKGWSNLS